MLAPVTHILALTTILRERLLPMNGRVLVRLNQKVSPLDVIAEARLSREHVLLDIVRGLGVPPAAADRLLRFKTGDEVSKDAVIAQTSGLLPRIVRAPQDGRVVAAGGGQVLLEVGDSGFELRAGIPGTVTQVVADRGAMIQTTGALIQGVWGNGRIDTGLLHNLAESPDHVLQKDDLDVSQRGTVLVAGHCDSADAIRVASELPARGLVLSSLAPSLLPVAAQAKFPIVVIDGFANRPMNTAAFKILSTNSRRDVAVNAEYFDRYSGVRPEVIIPLPVSQEPPLPHDLVIFNAGQHVRLKAMPNAGEIGTLSSILPGLTSFPSGLRAVAGEVRLESGDQVVVPLVNLEVLG